MARPPRDINDDPSKDPDGLTVRSRAVLDMIRTTVEDRGYPPSIREIGESVGLASPSSVAHQLRVLEAKGLLRKDANRPRALVVSDTDSVNVTDLGASFPTAVNVPVLGRIHELVGDGQLFMLKVVGESMIDAAICDGDFVVIRQQPSAENGDIVAALLGDEATVKTFKRKDGHVWLMPHNDLFEPIPGDDALILGKVVAVLRSL
ncbi:MAG: transcriptional repressor LexA [Actinobacteria bacterium]|nr:transcriptional repressor LexA [Actinomycetota bacterium]